MRIIIFLFIFFVTVQPALCQERPPRKNTIQSQMQEAINELNKQVTDLEKQIADAKKNKEDEGSIKEMEDQLAMLKKQVTMIGGVNRTMTGIPDKTFEQAGNKETIVPNKDIARINSLPQKIFTDAELAAFIINTHAEVEKMIPAAERTEALKFYNETKAAYRSNYAVANAATGCWMAGHWEHNGQGLYG
jgi:TolA-binding protein